MSFSIIDDVSTSPVGGVDMNTPNLMNRSEKAILYLFRPCMNSFKPVGRRAFQYNFDQQFLNDVAQLSESAMKGSLGAPGALQQLDLNHNLSKAINVGWQPDTIFRADQLNDRWRFILIFSSDSSDLNSAHTMMASFGSTSSKVRRIFNGYFEDEPMDLRTRTLNPHAFMVITHRTIVGNRRESTAWGGKVFLDTQVSDQVISPQVVNALTTPVTGHYGQLNLVTPTNCVVSVESAHDGSSIVVPGAHSTIDPRSSAETVEGVLEQPKHHLGRALKGIFQSIEDAQYGSRLNTSVRSAYGGNDMILDDELQRHRVAQFMQSLPYRGQNMFDLDVNDRISPVQIDNMVGGQLHVEDFLVERPIFHETADQTETSITNQFSSLIASVVPAVLSSAGLIAMDFTFVIARRGGQVVPEFRVYNREALWAVPEHDLEQMVGAAKMELARGIFSTIFDSQGDFHVQVKCNTTGFTSVVLTFLAHGMSTPVEFEMPSCLGGLVSPLVASTNIMTHNSEKIEDLYRHGIGSTPAAVTFGGGNESGGIAGFLQNPEDKEYQDFIDELDISFDDEMLSD